MSHEESGIEIPKSYKKEIIRMDNNEDDTAAFLYVFTEKYLKQVKIEDFQGHYFLELVSGGEQLMLVESGSLKNLKNKMVNFITGINWKESKDQAYIIY